MVAVLGAAALAVATGLPPLYDLVEGLPGFEAVRNGRLAVFTVLAVALLAGWGLDDLTGGVPAARRRPVLAVGIGLFALPLVVVAAGRVDLTLLWEALRVAWGFAAPPGGEDLADVVRLASVLEWLVFAAAAVVLLALRLSGRLGATAFVVLAVALVGADLFKAGMGYNPAIEERHGPGGPRFWCSPTAGFRAGRQRSTATTPRSIASTI